MHARERSHAHRDGRPRTEVVRPVLRQKQTARLLGQTSQSNLFLVHLSHHVDVSSGEGVTSVLRCTTLSPTNGSPLGFGLSLADLPAPRSQDLDDLWGDGGRQRDPYEYEALVDGIGQGELGRETYRDVSAVASPSCGSQCGDCVLCRTARNGLGFPERRLDPHDNVPLCEPRRKEISRGSVR